MASYIIKPPIKVTKSKGKDSIIARLFIFHSVLKLLTSLKSKENFAKTIKLQII